MNEGETTMISFVILTWNSEKYIGSCIESILSNVEVQNEVIVVDNGSHDATRDIVRSFDRVVLVELDRNMGTTVPRNMGIESSSERSKYICVLDSDTVVSKGTFEKLVDVFEKNEGIGLAAPYMFHTDGMRQNSFKKFPTLFQKLSKLSPVGFMCRWGESDESYENWTSDRDEDFFDVDYAISACWLVKRDALDRVGLFDEKIFYSPEDVDLCLRIWKGGYRVVAVPGTRIVHHYQRLSRKNPLGRMAIEHFKGLLYYFDKHGYYVSRRKLYRKLGR